MAKLCGKCGAPLEAGDRFCMNCGEPVKTVDEDLTFPLKSSDEKDNFKDTNGSENASEKKTGLAARAVHGSDVNPKETNKNADVSHDDVDNVLKQDKKKRAQKANNTTKVPKKKTGLAARAVRRLDDNSKEMNGNADDALKQMEADNRHNAHSQKRNKQQPDETHNDAKIPESLSHQNLPNDNTSKDEQKKAPQHTQNNTKKIAVIVGIIIGVIAIGALIYCFATGILPPKSTIPISFKINIDDGFTKDSTPIVAKITDKSNKDNVTYAAFTPDGGNKTEVNVPQGEYDITLISPINADGSIYDMGKAVTVITESENERNVSTSCKRIPADNVTSTQIQKIVDTLHEADKSSKLPDNASVKADKRLTEKKDAEEKLEHQAYDPIIEKYNHGISANYSTLQFRSEGLSEMVSANAFGDSSDSSRSLGYTLMDLDNNGTRELLIGEIGKPYILDMYTIKNGQAEQVLVYEARSRYYYAGENKILLDGSGGAYAHIWYLYEYNKGLVVKEGAESDGNTQENVQYYVLENNVWKTADQAEYRSKVQALEAMKETYEMTPLTASQ